MTDLCKPVFLSGKLKNLVMFLISSKLDYLENWNINDTFQQKRSVWSVLGEVGGANW